MGTLNSSTTLKERQHIDWEFENNQFRRGYDHFADELKSILIFLYLEKVQYASNRDE